METNSTDHSAEHFGAEAAGVGHRPIQTPMRNSISALFRGRNGSNGSSNAGYVRADTHPAGAHGADELSVESTESATSQTNPNIQFLQGQPGARRGGLRSSDLSSQDQAVLDQQLEREIQAWASDPSPDATEALAIQLMDRFGLSEELFEQDFDQFPPQSFHRHESGAELRDTDEYDFVHSETGEPLDVDGDEPGDDLADTDGPDPSPNASSEPDEPVVVFGEQSVSQAWLDERNEIVAPIDEQYEADRLAAYAPEPAGVYVVQDEDGNIVETFFHEEDYRQWWLSQNTSQLDDLAQHYGFENGEELLAAHPEIYVIFGQAGGPGRLGPPPAGYAMATADELAQLDGYLDDDDGIEQIIALDNEPIPEPTTPEEIAEMNRLGRERYFQSIRYDRARERLGEDYSAQRQDAIENGGPGWVLVSDYDGPITPDSIVSENMNGEQIIFSEAAFSDWYSTQDTVYGRYFADTFDVAGIPEQGETWVLTLNDGEVVIENGDWNERESIRDRMPDIVYGEASVSDAWIDQRADLVADIEADMQGDTWRLTRNVLGVRVTSYILTDENGNRHTFWREWEFRRAWLLQNPDKLDELAKHYGFVDGEALLEAHPEIYIIFNQPEGPGRLGPPPAGYAMASREELAYLDQYLDDDEGIEQIMALDTEPIPEPTTHAEIMQMNRLGRERYFQIIRFERAQNRVQADYLAERGEAAQNVGGPGWILLSESGIPIGDAGLLPNIPFGVPSGYLVRQNADGEWMVFSDAEFSKWYGAQDSPFGRFFASAYGVAEMQFRDGPFDLGYWEPTFNDGQVIIRDGRFISDGLREVDIANLPRLHNKDAVWFDPMVGWVTPEENIKRKTKWYKKLISVVVVGVAAYLTGGLAAGLVQGALWSGVVAGAASGAMSVIAGSIVSGTSISFSDVVRGAVVGAVTSYLSFKATEWNRTLAGITPETSAAAASGSPEAISAIKLAESTTAYQVRQVFGSALIKGFVTRASDNGDFRDAFMAGAIGQVANYVEGLGTISDDMAEAMSQFDQAIRDHVFGLLATAIRVGGNDGDFSVNLAAEYVTDLINAEIDQVLAELDDKKVFERASQFVNEDGSHAARNEQDMQILIENLIINPNYSLEDFREDQRLSDQRSSEQRPAEQRNTDQGVPSEFSYGNESRAGAFPLGSIATPSDSSQVTDSDALTGTDFSAAEQTLIDDIFLSREQITVGLPDGEPFAPDRSVSTYDAYYAQIDQLQALRFDTYRDTAANTPVTAADGGRDLYGELAQQWQTNLSTLGDAQIVADLQAADRSARLNAESSAPVNLTEAQWQTNAEVSDVNALIQLRNDKFTEMGRLNASPTVGPAFESAQQALANEIFALEILIEEESIDVEQSLDLEADIATGQTTANGETARRDYLLDRAGGNFGAATSVVREVALPGFQSLLADGGEVMFGGSDAEVEAVLDASDPAAVSATLDQRLQELRQSGSEPDQEALISQNKSLLVLTERFADRSEAAAGQGDELVAAYYANLALTAAMAFGQNDQLLLTPVQNAQSANEFELKLEYIGWRMDVEQSRLQSAEASGDTASAGIAIDSYTQLDILLTANQNALATWQQEQKIPSLRELANKAGAQQVPPQILGFDKLSGGMSVVSNPIDSRVPLEPEEAISPGQDKQFVDFWATNRTGYPTPGDAYNPIVGVAPGDDGVTITPVNDQGDAWTVVFDQDRTVNYRGNEIPYDAIRVERDATGNYQVLYEVAGLPIVADFNAHDVALWEGGLERVELVNTERTYLQSMQGVSPMEVNDQLQALGLQALPVTNSPVAPISMRQADGLPLAPEQGVLVAAQELQQVNRSVMDSPDDPILQTAQRSAQLNYQQQYWNLLSVRQSADIDSIDDELNTLDAVSDSARVDELTEERAGLEQTRRYMIAQRGNAELELLILREGGNTLDGSRALAFNTSPELFAAPMIDNFYLDPSTEAMQINGRDDALTYVLSTLHISRDVYDALPDEGRGSLDHLVDQIVNTGGAGAQVQVLPVIYQSDTGIDSTLVYSVTSASGQHHIVDVDGSVFENETEYREKNRTMNAIGDIKSVMPAGGQVVYDDAGKLILSSGDARIEGGFEKFRREWYLDYAVTAAGITALALLTFGTGGLATAGTVILWGATGYYAGTAGYGLLDAGLRDRSLSLADPEARMNYLVLGASVFPALASSRFMQPGIARDTTLIAGTVAGGAASVESTLHLFKNWEEMTMAEQREAILYMAVGLVPIIFAAGSNAAVPGPATLDGHLRRGYSAATGGLVSILGGNLGASLVLSTGFLLRGLTGTLGGMMGLNHFKSRGPLINHQTYQGVSAAPHAVSGVRNTFFGGSLPSGIASLGLLIGDSLLGLANQRLRHSGVTGNASAERLNNGITGVGFTATGLGAGVASAYKFISDPTNPYNIVAGISLAGISATALTKGAFDGFNYKYGVTKVDIDGKEVTRFNGDPFQGRNLMRGGPLAATALPVFVLAYGATEVLKHGFDFFQTDFATQIPITEDSRFGLFRNTVQTDGATTIQLSATDGVVGTLPPFELTHSVVANLPGHQSNDFSPADALLPEFSRDADSPGIERTLVRPADSAEFVVVEPGDTLLGIAEDNADSLLTESERQSFGMNTDAQTMRGLQELLMLNPQAGFDRALIDGIATPEAGDPGFILPGAELKVQAPLEPVEFPDPREFMDSIEK